MTIKFEASLVHIVAGRAGETVSSKNVGCHGGQLGRGGGLEGRGQRLTPEEAAVTTGAHRQLGVGALRTRPSAPPAPPTPAPGSKRSAPTTGSEQRGDPAAVGLARRPRSPSPRP